MIDQLRRQRATLLVLIVASAALAWWFPLLWAMTIVCVVLAGRNEWLIRRLRGTIRP